MGSERRVDDPVIDQPGNARLMKGYLDTSNTSETIVTVKGLSPGAYSVYVYVDGDNRDYSRSADYSISGTGFTANRQLLLMWQARTTPVFPAGGWCWWQLCAVHGRGRRLHSDRYARRQHKRDPAGTH